MTDPRTISYTREEHVGWIRMGQPDAMTLMSGPLMSEIRAALQTATADPEVRVLVLIGQGRTFIAGADLRFIRDASSEEFLEVPEAWKRMPDGRPVPNVVRAIRLARTGH